MQGHVDRELARVGGRALVHIGDDGPGVPKAMLESLTDRSTRLDERSDSTGMGLAIALEICVPLAAPCVCATSSAAFRPGSSFPCDLAQLRARSGNRSVNQGPMLDPIAEGVGAALTESLRGP